MYVENVLLDDISTYKKRYEYYKKAENKEKTEEYLSLLLEKVNDLLLLHEIDNDSVIRYELIPTYQGCEIRKFDGKFYFYVSKVYKGEYTWVRDYMYAKHFSLRVAKEHIRKLTKGTK